MRLLFKTELKTTGLCNLDKERKADRAGKVGRTELEARTTRDFLALGPIVVKCFAGRWSFIF